MRLFSLTLMITCTVLHCGCKPTETTDSGTDQTGGRPAASDVPVRIWAVAPIDDPDILKRKWLADSDQPIEVRSMSVEEFLSQDACACDIVLFPSRLTGELARREWIVSLPTSFHEIDSVEAMDSLQSSTQPGAWSAQSSYGGTDMSVPLGCSVPVWVTSESVKEKLGDTENPTVDALLNLTANVEALQIDPAGVDKDALVDRYLTILGTQLNDRNARYGLLFELRSMQPMLNQNEFVKSAELLKRLASQTSSGIAAVGSHDAAWKAVAESEEDVVTIASSNLLSESTASARQGNIVAQLTATDGKLAGNWNTGGGLVASISYDCSQSAQAILLLKWFRENSTRAFLAPVLPGVEASTPVFGADSLSWLARQRSLKSLGAVIIPQEPRLPGATEYRAALADELVSFLAGEVSARNAMSGVVKRWNAVTEVTGSLQLKQEYERSLELNF